MSTDLTRPKVPAELLAVDPREECWRWSDEAHQWLFEEPVNTRTLDRLEELDPNYYTEAEVIGLLEVDPDSDEAWQVRGAIAFWLEIPSWPDDATTEQAELWTAGRSAADAHYEAKYEEWARPKRRARLKERLAKALGLTGELALERIAFYAWRLREDGSILQVFDVPIGGLHTDDDQLDALTSIVKQSEGWTREGDKWTHVSGRCLERAPRWDDVPGDDEHWTGTDGGLYMGSGHPALFEEVCPF